MNIKFFNKKLRKKAFGLLEVLIAIALSAMVMIGAVVVASKGVKMVKRNELQDLANGILLRSLEVARSPVNVNFDKQIVGGSEGYFVLGKDDKGKQTVKKVTGVTGEIVTCDNNAYKVDLLSFPKDLVYVDDDFAESYQICNQIIVKEVANDGIRRTFQIRSILVYKVFGENVKSELISQRTEIIGD